MAQKKLAFIYFAILIFTSCISRSGVKTGPVEPTQQEPAAAPEQVLETVKIKPGAIITEKEAAAIRKINESLIRENVYQQGIATWYGRRFHGKRTANGEIYDMHKLTAAHKTLPFHTLVEVENLDNKKRVIVRINDRGPFLKERIIDLSYDAAKKLECHKEGVIPVCLRIIKPDIIPGSNDQSGPEIAAAQNSPGQKIETPEPTISSSPPLKFYLQAGAFSEKVNAQKMLKHMESILANVSFNIYFQNGLYKVISAPQASRARAEELKKALQGIAVDAFIKEQI